MTETCELCEAPFEVCEIPTRVSLSGKTFLACHECATLAAEVEGESFEETKAL